MQSASAVRRHGLTGELSDDRIRELLADDDPQQAATALVAAAHEAGGRDNITAVVVDVVDADDDVARADTTPRDLLPGQP